MTVQGSFNVRTEQPDDAAAVAELLDAAFSGPMEAGLVERLRANGELRLAFVAVREATVLGYAAWPRLWVESARGVQAAVGLAPLAVSPPVQRCGIGSALIHAGVAQLRTDGESVVFVLGDPSYYRRFGFSAETARAYESIYAGAHFMALALANDAPKSGLVRYPAPFNSLT